MSNIIISPQSGILEFNTGVASGSAFDGSLSGAARLKFESSGVLGLTSLGTGVTDKFTIDGSNGRLFTVNNTVTGSIFSVNDVAGLPIVEVFSDDRVVMGQYATDALVVSGSGVSFATTPTVNGNPIMTGVNPFDEDTLATVTARGASTSSNLSLAGDITVADGKFIGQNSTLSAIQFGDGSIGNEQADLSFVTDANGEFVFSRGGANKVIIGSTTNVSDGDFFVDTDTLYVDVSTDRVGIGTTSPAGKLDIIDTDSSNSIKKFHVGRSTNAGLYITDNDNTAFIRAIQDENEAGYGNLTLTADNIGNRDGYISFQTATENVRIKSDGNVGIGTTNPAAKLHVHDGHIRMSDGYKIDWGGTNVRIDGDNSSDYFRIFTSSTERLRVDTDGDVGIGTTIPAALLHVYSAGNGEIEVERNGGAKINLQAQASKAVIGTDSNHQLDLKTNGGARMSLSTNGDVGIGTTAPLDMLHIFGSVRADLKLEGAFQGATTDVAKFQFAYGPRSGDVNNRNIASISAYNTTTDSTAGGYLSITTRATNSTMQERIRVNQDGQVDIYGNASFASYLYHKGDEDTNIKFNTDDFIINVGGAAFFRATETTQNTIKLNSDSEDTDFYLYGNHSTPAMFMRGSDREIGINTTNPTASLHVVGNARIKGASSDGVLMVENAAGSQVLRIDQNSIRTTTDNNLTFLTNGNSNSLVLQQSTNHVGIGVTNPAAQLTVQGDNADFMVRSNDYTISRIIPRGDTSANWDKGLFSLFNASTEAVRIDSASSSWFNGGNVGIGTANPHSLLEVSNNSDDATLIVSNKTNGANGAYLRLLEAGTAFGTYGYLGGYIQYDGNNNLINIGRHNVNGTTFSDDVPAISIKRSDGNVGIGTTNPDELLRVVGGNICVTNGQYLIFDGAGSKNHKMRSYYDGSQGRVEIIVGGTDVMDLAADGSVGIGTTTQSTQFYNNLVVGNNSAGEKGITIRSNASNGGHLAFSDTDAQDAGRYAGRISYFHNTNKMQFYTTAGDHAMTIDNAQDVGIGTTNPQTRLTVEDSLHPLDVNRTDGSSALIQLRTQGGIRGYLGANSTDSLSVWNSTPSRLFTVRNGGNVGVGVADPDSKLEVAGKTHLGGRGQDGGAFIADGYATFSETNGGAATILGNAVHAGAASSTIRKTKNEDGNYIKLHYLKGLTFHTKATGNQGSTDYSDDLYEKMRIDLDGNVGIGVNDPDQKLDVNGNIRIPNQGKIVFGSAGSTPNDYLQLYDVGAGTELLKLVQDTTTRFSIEGGNGNVYMQGKVGIGTTQPADTLQVAGQVRIDGSTTDGLTITSNASASRGFEIYNNSSTDTASLINYYDGPVLFGQANAEKFRINTDGDLQIAGNGTSNDSFYLYFNNAACGIRRKTNDLILGGNEAIRFRVANTIVGNQTERMCILDDGNVGMGNTNPSDFHTSARNLVVGDGVGSQGITIYAQNNAGSNLYLADGTAGDQAYRGYISYSHSAEKLALGAGGQTRITATNAGLVGIGTLTPDTLLHLEASDPVLKIRDSSTTTNSATLWLQESDTHGVKINYQSSGGDRGRDFLTIDTLSASDSNNQAGNHDNAWGIDQDGYVMPHKGAVDGNLLKSYEWLLYGSQVSGSTPSFPRNGTEAENSRIYGHNPFGEPAILWYTPSQDSPDNDDGGWNSDTFIVDRGKSYRTSVWVKKETNTPADGNLYLGTNYVNNLNGTYNTNPYFLGGNTLNTFGESGQWYLFVGYIFDSGHSGTTAHPDGGIYDRNGRKLASANSFKFTDSGSPSDGLSSNFNTSRQRVYNYYDSNTGSKTYWWGPRFEPLEASTPTLQQILNTPTSDTGASFMGSVGVGISTQSQTNEVKLHVYKNANRATTVVQNNNHVARLEAFGNATAIDTTASNGVIIRNNGSNRVHFDAGGNVGIGVDDPSIKLEVNSAGTDEVARFQSTDNDSYISISDNTDAVYIGHDAALDVMSLGFSSSMGVSSNVNIDTNGFVGLGTNDPATRLDVVGTYRIADNTTNANNKIHRMLGRHYTNAEQEVNIFSSISTSSINALSFGGGSSSYNTATSIYFYTAANNTSTYAAGQERMRITNAGNIGIGVTNDPSSKLHVNGELTASTKTFDIEHPTQSGKRLIHGCFEGPEYGVYFRGKTQDSGIQAPEYWSGLVDMDSMTVDVTPIGANQSIYVDRIEDNGDVYVGANTEVPLNYFYIVYGERKDIDPLVVVKDAPAASPNQHID